jgi:hypothetical protein
MEIPLLFAYLFPQQYIPLPSSRNTCYSIYVCMYVEGVSHKIQPLHRDLQWSIVLPLLISPLLIPHLDWSVGLCIWGRHTSHLVLWKTGPGDEILNELQPHNHTGYSYVWLIHLLLGTFRKWDYESIPIWKGALLISIALKTFIWSGFWYGEYSS